MKKLLILTCILAGSASHADTQQCVHVYGNQYDCIAVFRVVVQHVKERVLYLRPKKQEAPKYTEQQREQMTALVDQLK